MGHLIRIAPNMPPSLMVYLPAIACLLLLIYQLRRKSPSNLSLPPGPKGLPVLGNFLDIDSRQPWTSFTQWASTHGRVLRFSVDSTLPLPKGILSTVGCSDGKSLSFNHRKSRKHCWKIVRAFIPTDHQTPPQKRNSISLHSQISI